MLAPCALARRLRSKRHDNAKEESQACPFYRRSIEPLNSRPRSRNTAESPADTVGECTLQAVRDLRLRTFRLTGPRNSALVRNRQRPWLRLNRWFATQGNPTSIVCPNRGLHSTGQRPWDPSDERHGSINSSIRARSSTTVDRLRIYLGIDLHQVCNRQVVRIEVQGRSICRTNLESHLTHPMFLWETSAVDRGAKPRPLESRGCPSSWRTQPRMLTSHALAGRMRSKRHDNAKEEHPTCPSLQRSIELLN